MARTWKQLRDMTYGAGVAMDPDEGIAYAIMRELDSRKGLTDDLDDDTKDEIFESLISIINR